MVALLQYAGRLVLGGSGDMLPREEFEKNGAIWCNLGVPKSAITKLKFNNFKVYKSTTTQKLIAIFPPAINLDVRFIEK